MAPHQLQLPHLQQEVNPFHQNVSTIFFFLSSLILMFRNGYIIITKGTSDLKCTVSLSIVTRSSYLGPEVGKFITDIQIHREARELFR